MHGLASSGTDRIGQGWKLGLLALGATIACVLPLVGAPSAKAADGKVYVTLGFDDAFAAQYQFNRDVLNPLGIHATYYVNSNVVENQTNGSKPVGAMTWPQLTTLFNSGNEIAGHTLDHANLPKILDSSERVRQVCQDRQNLIDHGFTPTNFAYPNGADGSEDQVMGVDQDGVLPEAIRSIVQDCGYDTGRITGRLDRLDTNPPSCCVFAESLPPVLPYRLRSSQALGGSSSTPSTLQNFKDRVTWAKTYGGGWLSFVFHDICPDSGCLPAEDTDIKKSLLTDVVNWIRQQPDVEIRTAAEVVAMYKPPVQPPVQPPPAVTPRVVPTPPLVDISINPLGKIASLKKSTKRRWKLTISVKHPADAKKVQVLLDGRVVKTLTRLSKSNVITLSAGVGTHKVKVRTTALDGKRYDSSTRTFHVKAKKKKKKKSG